MKLLDQSSHVFEAAVCAGCGDEVSIEFGTCYVSRNTTLCFECATRLGGRLDAWTNRWSVAPDVDGLQRTSDFGRSRTCRPRFPLDAHSATQHEHRNEPGESAYVRPAEYTE